MEGEQQAMEGGTKHDKGKPQITLVPRAAIEGAAQALMFGAGKYGRDNYKKGFEQTRLLDAAMRHLIAYTDGEDLDPESGLSHLDHALASVSMLKECIRLGTAKDDRFKKQ